METIFSLLDTKIKFEMTKKFKEMEKLKKTNECSYKQNEWT